MLLILVGYTFLINLSWGLAPEIQYDATNYHLAIPKLYAEAHGVVDLPYSLHSYYVRMLDFLFTFPMALNVPTTAKLIVLALSCVAALTLYYLAKRLFNARVGWWAAALFYTTPMIMWLSSTAYTDMPAAMFALASLLTLAHWLEKDGRAWLWVSALLVGMGIGVKPTVLYILPFIAIGLLWDILTERQVSLGTRLRTIVGFSLGLCLVAAPAYFLIYTLTGNPFYSIVNRGGEGFLSMLVGMSQRSDGLSFLLARWVHVPLDITFSTTQFGEALPIGSVGIVFALLPLAVLLVSRRRSVNVFLLGCLLGLIAWAVSQDVIYGRYYTPLLAVVTLLTIGVVDKWAAASGLLRLNFACLGVVLASQVCVTSIQYWQIPERFPVAFAFSLETSEHFLTRALPGYQAVQFLNSIVQPGEGVLTYDLTNMRLFLNAPLAATREDQEFPDREVNRTPQRLATWLRRRGYKYVMLTQQALSTESAAFIKFPFLDDYTRLIYSQAGINIYRLSDQPHSSVASPNLLQNPGFESLDSNRAPVGWQLFGTPAIVHNAQKARMGGVAVEVDTKNTLVQRVPVKGGQIYTLSHYTQADTLDQRARLQINWEDAGGRFLDASITVVPVKINWYQYRLTVKAPDQAAAARIYLSAQDTGSSATGVRLDDIRFDQKIYQ
jgi:hypothetical protein